MSERNWPAILADAKARNLGVCALARELGHKSPGRVSAENAKAGYPLTRKKHSGPIFRHPHKPAFRCPDAWRLTGQQAQLIAVLVDADGEVSNRDLVEKITSGERDPKILDVVVCKTRAKLRRFNIHIYRRWGRGFFLDPVQRARLRAGAVTLKPSERAA